MRFGFIIILLFCSIIRVGAQADFSHIDTRDGLSQNDINFIYQGSKGFMWFGTMDGLNRYDGINFKHYQITSKMEHPIGSNLPFCIAEDDKENFWIGTSDNGIWYFDRKNEKFYQFPTMLEDKRMVINNKVANVLLDSKGFLWAGSDRGLTVINTVAYAEGNFSSNIYTSGDVLGESDTSNSIDNVLHVTEGNDGQVWLCTTAGLFKANLLADKRLKVEKIQNTPATSCLLMLDTEFGYFASFGSGLYHFTENDIANGNGPRLVSTTYFNNFIQTSQNLFFGGNSSGLFQLEWDEEQQMMKDVNTFRHEFNNTRSISKNYVVALFEDRSGLLWVGTNGGGLNKLDLNKKKFNHVYQTSNEGSLGYNKIRAVHADVNDNLWIGTEGGGMSVLPRNKRNKPFEGFINQSVSTVINGQNHVYDYLDIPQAKGKVLVCMGYPNKVGIASLNRGQIEMNALPQIVPNPVFVAMADRSGFIWLGTYGAGVYKCQYNHAENTIDIINQYTSNGANRGALSSNIIRSLLEDSHGNILIGTDNGINLLKVDEKSAPHPFFIKAQYFSGDSTSLSHNYVLDMFLDKDDNVWVGTMGGGLCLLKKYEQDVFEFQRFSSENGLPNDAIKGIEQDEDGYLWISSNRGLTKFDPSNGEIRNYSVADGLQDYEFSELASMKVNGGEMYFGGINGLNVFKPSEIKDNPYASQVEFTNLQILNDNIIPGMLYNGRVVMPHEMPSLDGIKLKFIENSFTIGFSAFHFAAPEKISYKYMLEGFDDNWVLVKNGMEPMAKYTNMAPGKYELKVLATNNDGVWNTVPATFKVEVVPPFWRTEWAILLYIILFFVLLRFFKKYSVIAVTQKNQLMMEHFEQEKMEELVQMKLQFFTNISHEFRTPLTLIQSPLEKLMAKADNIDEDYRQRNYTLMSKNVAILNRLINQLMDFRKLEKGKMPLEVTRGNFNDLVNEVFNAFKEIALNKNIRFELRNTYSSIELWFDYDKIEKVLYNILSNAFKFTPQGGSVCICVDEVEIDGKEWVKVDVIDNGPGIEEEKLPFLFQRFYQAGSHKLSKVSGTGIGLAFAKNLIKMHQGDLIVKSRPNIETTFSILLKKGKMHFSLDDFSKQTPDSQVGKIKVLKDYQDGAARPDTPQKEKMVDKTKATVLVVEDNHDVQSLLKENLEEHYNCIQAFNGEEGLELCRKHTPDIVLSDVMMPKKDGYEMCAEIKQDNAICHIPIVMLTARSSDVDKMSGFEGGAEAYVSKPFNVDILLAQIKSILDARKSVRDKFSSNLDIQPEEVTFTSIDEKLIERLLKYIEKNISNPEFTVVQLADEVGMSQSILNKKLKAILGQTANVFIRSIRLKRAAQLLKLQRLAVMDVVYEVGFNDVKYFRECFRKHFDMTPSEYAKQFKEEEGE